MRLLDLFQKEIASLIISLITTGVLFLFRSRVRLIWSSPHSWNFLITPPPPPTGQAAAPSFGVYTASIFVQNSGRIPATEVELTFNWEPPNFNIWPVRPYTTHKSLDGRFTLLFPNLAPREYLQIELLGNAQMPALVTVRSKECVGELVRMQPMLVVERWLLYIRWTLIILGMAAIIYLLIKLASLFF